MQGRRAIQGGMMMAASVALAACSSTSLVDQWSAPQAERAVLHKVVVVGISQEEANRRTFEDVFAHALQSQGVGAVPLYQLQPKGGQVPEAELKQLVANSGADAVLVTRVTSVKQQLRQTPGYPDSPYWGRFGFYGFYGDAWMNYRSPPSVQSYNVALMETNLWSAASGQLLWSATTQTWDPGKVADVSRDFSKVVGKALFQQGFLAKPQP